MSFLTLFTIDVIATINSWNHLNSKLTLLHNYLIERINENLDDLATRLKNSDLVKRTKDKRIEVDLDNFKVNLKKINLREKLLKT